MMKKMMKKMVIGIFLLSLMVLSSASVLGCSKWEGGNPLDWTNEVFVGASAAYGTAEYDEYEYGVVRLSYIDNPDVCYDENTLIEKSCAGPVSFYVTWIECNCEEVYSAERDIMVGRCSASSSEKVIPNRPECSDGVDNDGDGTTDYTGGCDVDGDSILSTKAYVEEWNIYIDERQPHISSKFDCEGYYNGVWYEADSVCTSGIGPKVNTDAGPNYDSESVLGVTSPSKYECADGLDNDGDGLVDYDNGNEGWCDVDLDGKISTKAQSVYTEEWVDETDFNKCQCENLHGYGDESCLVQPSFLDRLFGRETTSVTEDTSSPRVVGNFFLWITGNEALPVTPPNTDECSADDDCEQRGKFGTECIEGECVTITSGEVTKPKTAANWYDYDTSCDGPTGDNEAAFSQDSVALAPDFEITEEETSIDYCLDGYDNDNDGLIDAEDPGCSNAETFGERNRCGDNFDNDHDGYTDMEDPECSEESDDSERDGDVTESTLGSCCDCMTTDGVYDWDMNSECAAVSDSQKTSCEQFVTPAACGY